MCRSRLTTPRSSAARFSLFRSASSTPPWYLRARTVADRKSTRLNSSHLVISYAAFRFKKKSPSCGKKSRPDQPEYPLRQRERRRQAALPTAAASPTPPDFPLVYHPPTSNADHDVAHSP